MFHSATSVPNRRSGRGPPCVISVSPSALKAALLRAPGRTVDQSHKPVPGEVPHLELAFEFGLLIDRRHGQPSSAGADRRVLQDAVPAIEHCQSTSRAGGPDDRARAVGGGGDELAAVGREHRRLEPGVDAVEQPVEQRVGLQPLEQRAPRLLGVIELERGHREQEPEVRLALDDAARDSRNAGDVGPITRVRSVALLDQGERSGQQGSDQRDAHAGDQDPEPSHAACLASLDALGLGPAGVGKVALRGGERGLGLQPIQQGE